MGDVVLGLLLEREKKLKEEEKKEILMIPINTLDKCIVLAEKLRESGVNVKLDLQGKNISKNLDYANKDNIQYVIIVGDDEIKKNKLRLKDMKTGKEKLINTNDIKKII